MSDGDPAEGTVVFLHLPRTGGTTLNSVIDRQYGRDEVLELYGEALADPRRALREAVADRDRVLRVVRGHFPYGIHDVIDRPVRYVTMLRRPIPRLLSQYHYVRTQPGHRLHDRLVDEDISVRDYVQDPMTSQVVNGQVRMLVDDPELHGDEGFRDVTEDDVERAKRTLDEHCVAFGLTDEYDRSLALIADRLGWRHPRYVRKGSGSGRPTVESLDEATLEALQDATSADRELVRYSRQRFEEIIRESSVGTDDIEELEKRNRFYRIVYPFTRAPVDLARRAVRKIKGALSGH